MKYIYYYILSCCYILTYTHDPLLVVAIMVKNEEQVIEKTLVPFINSNIDAFVVFDTGSTDNTIARVENFYARHPHIRGYIFQEEFIDFATSRNRALELVHICFPHAAFIIMPDAEWYIYNAQDLYTFCEQELCNTAVSAYLIRLRGQHNSWYQTRLIRCGSNAQFIGCVHEVILATEKVPPSIFFSIEPTPKGVEKSRARWLRDRDLLLKEHERNPQDPRTVFYLGQTYDCLNDSAHAYYWYLKRAEMNGWDQETFVTLYRLGMTTEELMYLDPEKYSWSDALAWYLAAYEFRPSRAEPLYKIAQYYWDNEEWALAYFFAKHTAEIPYPTDILFVDQEIYMWERYNLLGCCAWHVQEYEEGRTAVLKALAIKNDLPHLIKNLAWYDSMLGAQK
jgi:glycosyltransferase involved in cell wall biosynthesis